MGKFLSIAILVFFTFALQATDLRDTTKVSPNVTKCDCAAPPFFVNPVVSANCEVSCCLLFDIPFAVDTCQLILYNRWGEKSMELELDCSNDLVGDICNEGEQKLNTAPITPWGTYIYMLRLKLPDQSWIKYCGSITILR